jgi:ATP-dependent Clp protease ATP-binding subunit ClpC
MSDAPLGGSALEVLALARKEADRFRHEYVGTEHLALAFTRVREGTVSSVLDELTLDRHAVQTMIESMVRPGAEAVAPSVALPYTSRTQTALALAAEGAAALGHDTVGAEHLLLGLLREARGIGGQILLHHGLSAEAVADWLTASGDAR